MLVACQGKISTRAMQWPHNHCNINSVFLIDYYKGSALSLRSHCNGLAMALQWLHKYETIAMAARPALHIALGYESYSPSLCLRHFSGFVYASRGTLFLVFLCLNMFFPFLSFPEKKITHVCRRTFHSSGWR